MKRGEGRGIKSFPKALRCVYFWYLDFVDMFNIHAEKHKIYTVLSDFCIHINHYWFHSGKPKFGTFPGNTGSVRNHCCSQRNSGLGRCFHLMARTAVPGQLSFDWNIFLNYFHQLESLYNRNSRSVWDVELCIPLAGLDELRHCTYLWTWVEPSG